MKQILKIVGIVVLTLIALKFIKPMLPTALQNYL